MIKSVWLHSMGEMGFIFIKLFNLDYNRFKDCVGKNWIAWLGPARGAFLFCSWILKNVELAQKCRARSVQPFNIYLIQTNRLAMDVYMGEVEFFTLLLNCKIFKDALNDPSKKDCYKESWRCEWNNSSQSSKNFLSIVADVAPLDSWNAVHSIFHTSHVIV